MFRFEFKVKTSMVQKYTLMLSVVCLVLTFLNQLHSIYYIGVTYVIGIILLGKIEQIKHALTISGIGCLFDFFYLIFHCSDSDWVSIRFIEFLLQFLAFLFEIVWMLSVYCYLKQRQEMLKIKDKLNWIDKQMNEFPPNCGSEESMSPDAANQSPTSDHEPSQDTRAGNVHAPQQFNPS